MQVDSTLRKAKSEEIEFHVMKPDTSMKWQKIIFTPFKLVNTSLQFLNVRVRNAAIGNKENDLHDDVAKTIVIALCGFVYSIYIYIYCKY